jgi:sugar lactone lactonase YvrE
MRAIIIFTFLFFFLFPFLTDSATHVKMIAGRGVTGSLGDGAAATLANIAATDSALYVDSIGNLFLPDQGNRKVRKVDAVSGFITTFAGTGSSSQSGTGGPLLSTPFKSPVAITGDSLGKYMYLTDLYFIWRFNMTSEKMSVFCGTTGGQTFSGENVAATLAQVNAPRGLWLTTGNDLYFADSSNWRVRKISIATAIITTYAGSNAQGSAGDGIFATMATLNLPYNVYMDTAGVLFIADYGGKKIRRVAANGIISTFAGTGSPQTYNGDGFPAIYACIIPKDVKGDSLGIIYIADMTNNRIRKVDLFGIITTFLGTGLSASSLTVIPISTSVDVSSPRGLWVDSLGNVYFNELGIMIRQTVTSTTSTPSLPPVTSPLSSSNSFLQRVAGNGIANADSGDNGPASSAGIEAAKLWVDTVGTVYFPENNRIRRVKNGIITSFGGTGYPSSSAGKEAPITSVQFYDAISIIGDSAGNYLYISDQWYIWRYSFATGNATVFAGSSTQGGLGDNGPATLAQLYNQVGIALNEMTGDLFIADFTNHRVRRVSGGMIYNFAGQQGMNSFFGDGGPAVAAKLFSPTGICVNSNGFVYIVDSSNFRIRSVDNDGIIRTVAGGAASGSAYLGDNVPATLATLGSPRDVKVDLLGNLYIASNSYKRILIVNTAGILSTFVGNGQTNSLFGSPPLLSPMNSPEGLWVDSLSQVYFSEIGYIRKAIQSSTSSPSPVPVFVPNVFQKVIAGVYEEGYTGDNGPATSAQMSMLSFWVTSTGDIYAPDSTMFVVRLITASNGIISNFAGSGTSSITGGSASVHTVDFNEPCAIVGDAAGTVFYISDHIFVWKYTVSNGIVAVIAGNPALPTGFNGDGTALTAQLNDPTGLWLTTANHLYVADTQNNLIRKIVSTIISTVAGSGAGGATPNFGGDFGPATTAFLHYPTAMFVDTLGSMYIADNGNYRIRFVDTLGMIATFAGNGNFGYNGNNIPAGEAMLHSTNDVKGDSLGNIYFTDTGNCLIRVINTAGILMNLVGNNDEGATSANCAVPTELSPISSPINNPLSIWIDSLGVLYWNSDSKSIHRTVIITPTSQPSSAPSRHPSGQPTVQPSRRPSSQPSRRPSGQPSSQPSSQPSRQPWSAPTTQPSVRPSGQPSRDPSAQPSGRPSSQPSSRPTTQPTRQPVGQPSTQPSAHPTGQPSVRPSRQPTSQPSVQPSSQPIGVPTTQPSSQPSSRPTRQPTTRPTAQPSSKPSR